jgi:hypothetical protein
VRRALLAAALLLAAVAPAASAAPFGELPFRPVSGVANCVRTTGLPGELSRWTPDGVELSTASAGGIVAHSTVPLRGMTECPVVVSDPSGFAGLAVATKEGVRVAVREPTGSWDALTTIPAKLAGHVHVAVSARGDVLVAWAEGSEDANPSRFLARAVLRPPGGPYGKPQQIGGVSTSMDLAAGLSADGEALLVTGDAASLRVATARPGAVFGTPRRIAAAPDIEPRLALAVGADGRALLAWTVGGQLGVFERPPRGAFARVASLPASDYGGDVAVAMGTGGACLVAVRSGDEVSLIRRVAGAAFGAPVVLRGTAPMPPPTDFGGGEPILSVTYSSGLPADGQSPLRALLEPDGRALLTWGADQGGGFAATVDPAGAVEVESAGSTLRDIAALTPLLLADTTHAIAWSDNNVFMSRTRPAGRLHLAIEGAPPAASAPVPELEVGAPVDASLRPAQSLVLPVRCSAACDVRVHSGIPLFDPGLTLERAGTARLDVGTVIPSRSGTVKVNFSWSAPGAHEIQERTASVHVRRLPRPPFPRLLNVRARHEAGGVVDVRWSTDVAARDVSFLAYVTHARPPRGDKDTTTVTVGGKGRRRFHVKLTGAARARWVRVFVTQSAGTRERHVLVRVT